MASRTSTTIWEQETSEVCCNIRARCVANRQQTTLASALSNLSTLRGACPRRRPLTVYLTTMRTIQWALLPNTQWLTDLLTKTVRFSMLRLTGNWKCVTLSRRFSLPTTTASVLLTTINRSLRWAQLTVSISIPERRSRANPCQISTVSTHTRRMWWRITTRACYAFKTCAASLSDLYETTTTTVVPAKRG